jgi:hypothetical protein
VQFTNIACGAFGGGRVSRLTFLGKRPGRRIIIGYTLRRRGPYLVERPQQGHNARGRFRTRSSSSAPGFIVRLRGPTLRKYEMACVIESTRSSCFPFRKTVASEIIRSAQSFTGAGRIPHLPPVPLEQAAAFRCGDC